MPKLSPEEMANLKVLLIGAMACAAPALVPLVTMVSATAVDVLRQIPLDRFGLAAAFVVLASMGYLLWRGYWWAAIPALASAAASVVFFSWKFIRPLSAYIKANDMSDFGSHIWPLMLLTPHLVLVLLTFTVGLVALKGLRTARQLGPRGISPVAKGVIILWLVLLAGDAVYQHYAWRYMQQPSDMVVRMCIDKPELRTEVQGYLLKMGDEAVPALLEAMATPDPDLSCLRDSSREMLLKMGPAVAPKLLEAAIGGSREALAVLQELGDPRMANRLLEHYHDEKRKRSPEYDELLRQTITKLNPTLKIE